MGCYGKSHMHTPNIDGLAKSGMRFDRAYCQQAVCNPSRTSFLTGMRPEETGVTGNHAHFRDQLPKVVTLPQHFKQHGYQSEAIGKIYHGVFPDGASKTKWDTMGDPMSWSRPALRFGPRYYYTEKGIASAKEAYRKSYGADSKQEWTKKLVFGLASEAPEVTDSTLYDGQVADAAVKRLDEFASSGQSFFLAVGFIKPHSPFIAPKKYFDLYPDVGVAGPVEFPRGSPDFAGHNSAELRRYCDQPNRGPIPLSSQQEVRRAYYACVSFIDAQIGRVLETLEATGLSRNTIVVLLGDHGYHLGEQGLWGKTTNFELDTRVPLVIRAPGVTTAGSSTAAVVELVDLFPTLAELAGLPLPSQLSSQGLVRTLREPSKRAKGYALSQYPRAGGKMGYSIRNDTHRLTQWVDRESGRILDRELYDYSQGEVETRNIADLKPDIVGKMLPKLVECFGVRLVTAMTNDEAAENDSAVPVNTITSFEKVPAGEFKRLQTAVGVWTPVSGRTIIDNKHAKSGRQCLQLTGGEHTSVTLQVGKQLDLSGDLTFWAERWTSRQPFQFRIEKKNQDGWSEIYNGDRLVRVGRAFLTKVKIPLNDPSITQLRFSVQSPPGTGILIDDLQIALPARQVITSAGIVPVVLPALVGAKTSALVKVNIRTTGSRDPISLTNVDFSVRGHEGDLARTGIFATDSNSRFSGDQSFGESVDFSEREEQATISGRVEGETDQRTWNINVRGRRLLVEGDNYFWVACSLDPDADISGKVSATVRQLGFSNGEDRKLDGGFQTQRLGVALRTRGDDGVHTYRIPGLATTTTGTLIGVYDVRRRSGGDLPGDIDVGMSRSTNGGQTWDQMKIIMDMGDDPKWSYDGIGDPAVLVDEQTGTIWVAATWSHGNRSWRGSGQGMEPSETGQLMLVKSTDDGITWSDPINITKQVKKNDWCFVLQGPGKGITMRDGTLVFAAQYQDPPNLRRLPHSTIIYSKDHGATWNVGSGAFDDTTESQVVEIEPGVLMLNCRYNRKGVRVVMITRDMGATWEKHVTSERALIEPGACMASLIDVGAETGRGLGGCLLFSNPDSNSGRNHISIKASMDRGLTWPKKFRLLLDEEPSAGYSCMSMIDQDTIGILYEGSQAHMTFQRVKLSDVLGVVEGNDKVDGGPPVGTSSQNVRQSSKQTGSEEEERPQHLLTLPAVFGNHMVMQRGIELPIWGKARAGSKVQVTLGRDKKTVVAGDAGGWMVHFSPREASFDPIDLVVRCGSEELRIRDVLVGEVWLCAGQSNMEWTVDQSLPASGEVDPETLKNVRLLNLVGAARGSTGSYRAGDLKYLKPSLFARGQWEISSKTSIGRFSAVAWFFGMELQKRLQVPVGLICPAIGGTPTESWVSRDALATQPGLQGIVQGYWLDNPRLSGFCQIRAEQNLLPAIQAGEFIPSDELGPNHSFKPGFMWEATIEPMAPYAMRGVVWYQGESNAE
ncbi:MAG: sulfatase-like hydrolase/transferase, partial [Rubripirellula sp.]